MGKNNEQALIKEIRTRATVLVVTLAVVDIVFVGLMIAKLGSTIAVAVLSFLSLLASIGLVLGILAIIKPLKFKKMFRNLKNDNNEPVRHNMRGPETKGKTKKVHLDSKLFNRLIPVETNAPLTYVNKCMFFLLNLGDARIDRMCEMSIQYYNDFKEAAGEFESNMPAEVKGREILDWIYPKKIYIDDNCRDEDDVELIVECDCAWEPEHGLEIIVACNEIVHVGAYDGDLEYWKADYIQNSAD